MELCPSLSLIDICHACPNLGIVMRLIYKLIVTTTNSSNKKSEANIMVDFLKRL
ncbi:MAG: hypothetical protein K2W97_05520 [Chthoniobacterales bacterium]|nr:hypothetical protein [Chthoniobacterales bacterium]